MDTVHYYITKCGIFRYTDSRWSNTMWGDVWTKNRVMRAKKGEKGQGGRCGRVSKKYVTKEKRR